MAAGDWWEKSPGLRQVFGAIQTAVSEGATTAEVWETVRGAANDIASGTLGLTLGRDPTSEEIAQGANGILRGMNAIDMNYARSAAAQLVNAHRNLLNSDAEAQITNDQIGQPPWSTTANSSAVRTQYRIRVQRDITFHGINGDVTRQEWATYNITGAIGSINDALDQANSLYTNSDYNRRTSINGVLDYTIEAI